MKQAKPATSKPEAKPLSPGKMRAEIVRLRRDAMPFTEVAKRLGISRSKAFRLAAEPPETPARAPVPRRAVPARARREEREEEPAEEDGTETGAGPEIAALETDLVDLRARLADHRHDQNTAAELATIKTIADITVKLAKLRAGLEDDTDEESPDMKAFAEKARTRLREMLARAKKKRGVL